METITLTTPVSLTDDEQGQAKPRRSLLQVLTMMLLVGGIAAGLLLAAAPSPANAASTQCGNGRCVVYLNKAETQALAQGRAPAISQAAPWQLKASYWALVQGHRAIAKQYANRGWCSAFLMSIYPWENQGYTGYRC